MRFLNLFIFLLLVTGIYAQYYDYYDATDAELPEETQWEGQRKGCYVPSKGYINVLIIFVQFPDDQWDIENTDWPKGGNIINKETWVDEVWSDNPTTGSLTHYFNEMSFDSLKFTGREISVTTPHTRQWYLDNNKKRWDIHKEIIQAIDDSIDFNLYDNFKYVTKWETINEPDGIVDEIFIIWRNIANEYEFETMNDIVIALNFENDIANLGGVNESFHVENGTLIVKSRFGGGSGLTVCKFPKWKLKKTKQTLIHEFGHHLLGGGEHTGLGNWGIMATGNDLLSVVANPYERYRLGWIDLDVYDINSNSDTISLSDYIFTGDAVQYQINSNNQCFYIENHQCLSYWETDFAFGVIEPGIYVFRQDYFSNTAIKMIPADGRFRWEVNKKTKPDWAVDSLPVFKQCEPSRVSGFHDHEYIMYYYKGRGPYHNIVVFSEDEEGNTIFDPRCLGNGDEAFSLGYNEVFSPWSNPNSQNVYKESTFFGFKINSKNTYGTYSLDIYINNAQEGPPSKPQPTLLAIDGVTLKPKLTWLRNEEPDMPVGSNAYKIYRNGVYVNTVTQINAGVNPTFIDNSFTNYGNNVTYTIKAMDSQGLESVYSEPMTIYMPPILASTISSNTNLTGEYLCNQTTVNSGATLTLAPGSRIRFASGKRMYISGNIVADATENNPITFTAVDPNLKWGGLYLQGPNCTDLIFDYCNISYSNYCGIYSLFESPRVTNCTFSYCQYGISSSNANGYPGGGLQIENNKFSDITYTAIVLSNSYATIFNNTISNCYAGLSLTSCSPDLATDDRYGYNNFNSISKYGIYANTGCSPRVGRVSCQMNGGRNTLMVNDGEGIYYIYAKQNNQIYAENNYWGTSGPVPSKFYTGSGSWIDRDPYLDHPPTMNGQQNLSPETISFERAMNNVEMSMSGSSPITEEEIMKLYNPKGDWGIKYKLFFAQKMLDLGFYNLSKNICKEVVNNYPDSTLSIHALNIFNNASQFSDDKDFKVVVKGLSSKKDKKFLNGYASLFAINYDRKNFIKEVDKIIEKYQGESIEELALYEKFKYYYFEEGNTKLAESVFKELESKYPESLTTIEFKTLLESTESGMKKPELFNGNEFFNETMVNEIPKEYKLENNYPNPFNPSTVISYQLPVVSDVRLVIYDILGREVITLVNGNQSAGKYSVEWNGRNASGTILSSGIYIYRIEAKSNESEKTYSSVKKMMLIK